jgi:predicted ATPase
MVKSITFNKVTLSKARNYMTDLPCLIGKTFEFKPGANILCGYNGCGKTSILKAIRAMTFCERKRYSSISKSTFVAMHINAMINEYYELVDLQNDWRYSVFSCRHNNEIDGVNFTDDIGTLSQFFASNEVSAGMRTFMALNQLLHDLSTSATNGGNCKIRDFWTNVMKVNLSEHFDNFTLDNSTDSNSIGRVKK